MRAPRAVIVGVLGLALWCVVAADAPAATTLTLLGADKVEVKAKDGQDTATAYLTILNAGKEDAQLHIELQAASATGPSVGHIAPPSAAAGQATRVALTLTGLNQLKSEKVDGQLVVEDVDGTPIAKQVSITPAPHPSRDWPAWIFYGALIVAGALFVTGVAVGLKDLRLFAKAPGPKWSFSSWATTATAVGGILGTVLGAATLPDVPSQIDKDTLVRLNLLYGALVVAGPFVFQALRNPFASVADQDAGYVGWNVTLLISCSITAAAVFGELAALGLLGWELTGGGTWGIAIRDSVIALGVLAGLYFVTTVVGLVRTDWKQNAVKATQAAGQRDYRLTVRTGVGDSARKREYDIELDDREPETGTTEEAYATASQRAPAAAQAASAMARASTFATSWHLP